jgi:hypothetical protein
MHLGEDLTAHDNKTLKEVIKDQLDHRKSDKRSRLDEISRKVTSLKEKVGFVMEDAKKLNEIMGKIKELEKESKRISALTDNDLLLDRFCDRIRI